MEATDPPLAAPSVALGRHRVQQAILLFIGMDLISTFLYVVNVGFDRALPQSGRFLVAVLVSLALYRGARWARWLMLAFVAAGVWTLTPGAVAAARAELNAGSLFLVLMLVGYIALGRILLRSPHVPAFLAARRAELAR